MELYACITFIVALFILGIVTGSALIVMAACLIPLFMFSVLLGMVGNKEDETRNNIILMSSSCMTILAGVITYNISGHL